VRLTPAEQDRLLSYLAAQLARERQARGVELNVPEATALIVHAACEAARDGARLSEAIEAARSVLTTRDVMPGVPAILSEIQVEAVFRDGTKLVVITDPIGQSEDDPSQAPGATVLAPQPQPHDSDRIRVEVTNTSDRVIGVTSHFHFFEANRALAFDRRAAYGHRLALPVGTVASFDPGATRSVELTPLRGQRRVIGFAGLVDGSLDSPGAREEALARARAAGYLDIHSHTEEGSA
jgi:urease subunit gamma/beta